MTNLYVELSSFTNYMSRLFKLPDTELAIDEKGG